MAAATQKDLGDLKDQFEQFKDIVFQALTADVASIKSLQDQINAEPNIGQGIKDLTAEIADNRQKVLDMIKPPVDGGGGTVPPVPPVPAGGGADTTNGGGGNDTIVSGGGGTV